MSQYLIESEHTKEECIRALDEITESDPQLLEKFEFGCMAGDHTGWATVEAGSEEEARKKVPDFLQSKTRVVEVSKFTPEQVRSFHQM